VGREESYMPGLAWDPLEVFLENVSNIIVESVGNRGVLEYVECRAEVFLRSEYE
jgi:hypothetical protein